MTGHSSQGMVGWFDLLPLIPELNKWKACEKPAKQEAWVKPVTGCTFRCAYVKQIQSPGQSQVRVASKGNASQPLGILLIHFASSLKLARSHKLHFLRLFPLFLWIVSSYRRRPLHSPDSPAVQQPQLPVSPSPLNVFVAPHLRVSPAPLFFLASFPCLDWYPEFRPTVGYRNIMKELVSRSRCEKGIWSC